MEQIQKTVDEFDHLEQNKKSNKVKKDFKSISQERAYPYLNKDFYLNRTYNNPQNSRPWGRFNKRNTLVDFSDTSAESSDNSDAGEGSSTSTRNPNKHFISQGQSDPSRRGRGKQHQRWQNPPGERQTRHKHYQW